MIVCQHSKLLRIKASTAASLKLNQSEKSKHFKNQGNSTNLVVISSPQDEIRGCDNYGEEMFQNCFDCGAIVMNSGAKSIKDERYQFQVDNSPAEMLRATILQEKNQRIVVNPQATDYLKERPNIVNQIFDLGKRFSQREDTIHLAIELLDRFFLSQQYSTSDSRLQTPKEESGSSTVNKRMGHNSNQSCSSINDHHFQQNTFSQQQQQIQGVNRNQESSLLTENFNRFDFTNKSSQRALYEATCFLIASKYDELDENIPMIKDLIRYYSRFLPAGISAPTFTQIVECERQIMKFLNWELMLVTPTMILKLMLANGILFENEPFIQVINDKQQAVILAKAIADRCLKYMDFIVKNLPTFRDKSPSFIASAVLYQSRKDEISRQKLYCNNPEEIQLSYWCVELNQMTGYSEQELSDYGKKIKRRHYGKYTPSEKKRKNKENLSQKQSPGSIRLSNKFKVITSQQNSISKQQVSPKTFLSEKKTEESLRIKNNHQQNISLDNHLHVNHVGTSRITQIQTFQQSQDQINQKVLLSNRNSTNTYVPPFTQMPQNTIAFTSQANKTSQINENYGLKPTLHLKQSQIQFSSHNKNNVNSTIDQSLKLILESNIENYDQLAHHDTTMDENVLKNATNTNKSQNIQILPFNTQFSQQQQHQLQMFGLKTKQTLTFRKPQSGSSTQLPGQSRQNESGMNSCRNNLINVDSMSNAQSIANLFFEPSKIKTSRESTRKTEDHFKIQAQLLKRGSSKMNKLLRESAEYISSNNSSMNGAPLTAQTSTNTTALHTTRVPPQMRPGLNQRSYQFQQVTDIAKSQKEQQMMSGSQTTRNNSNLTKLPAIDTNHQSMSSLGFNTQQVKLPQTNRYRESLGNEKCVIDEHQIIMNRRSKSWKKSEDEAFALTANLRAQLKSKYVNLGHLSSRVANQYSQSTAQTNFTEALAERNVKQLSTQQTFEGGIGCTGTTSDNEMVVKQTMKKYQAYAQSKSSNVSLAKRKSDQSNHNLQSLSSFSNDNCSSQESQKALAKKNKPNQSKMRSNMPGSNNTSKIRLQSKKAFGGINSVEHSLDRHGAQTTKNKSVVNDFKPLGKSKFVQNSQSPNFYSNQLAQNSSNSQAQFRIKVNRVSPVPKIGDDHQVNSQSTSSSQSSSNSQQQQQPNFMHIGKSQTSFLQPKRRQSSNLRSQGSVSHINQYPQQNFTIENDDQLCCVIEEEDHEITLKPKKPANQADPFREQMIVSSNIRKIIQKNQSKREISADGLIKKSFSTAQKYFNGKIESSSHNSSRIDLQQQPNQNHNSGIKVYQKTKKL
eukprot:403334403